MTDMYVDVSGHGLKGENRQGSVRKTPGRSATLMLREGLQLLSTTPQLVV